MDIQVVSVSSSSRQGTSHLPSSFQTSLRPGRRWRWFTFDSERHMGPVESVSQWSMWPALCSLQVSLGVACLSGSEKELYTPRS